MKTFEKTSAKLEFHKSSPISLYARKTTQRPCKVAQFTQIPRYIYCSERENKIAMIFWEMIFWEMGSAAFPRPRLRETLEIRFSIFETNQAAFWVVALLRMYI